MPEKYYTAVTGFYDKHDVLQAVRIQTVEDGRLVEKQYYREDEDRFSYEKKVSQSVNYLRQPQLGPMPDPQPNPEKGARLFTLQEVMDRTLGIAQNTDPQTLFYLHDGVSDETTRLTFGEPALAGLTQDLSRNTRLLEARQLFERGQMPNAAPSLQPTRKSSAIIHER